MSKLIRQLNYERTWTKYLLKTPQIFTELFTENWHIIYLYTYIDNIIWI